MRRLKIVRGHPRQKKINSIQISRRQSVTSDDASNSLRPMSLQQILEPAFTEGHQLTTFLRPGQLATTGHTSFAMGKTHGKALPKWPSILTWRCAHISCSLEKLFCFFLPFWTLFLSGGQGEKKSRRGSQRTKKREEAILKALGKGKKQEWSPVTTLPSLTFFPLFSDIYGGDKGKTKQKLRKEWEKYREKNLWGWEHWRLKWRHTTAFFGLHLMKVTEREKNQELRFGEEKSDVSIETPLKTNASLRKREYANKGWGGGLRTTK